MTDLDSPLSTVPHPNDTQAMRAYTQTYDYDEVGNILGMFHTATSANWNRHYTYDSSSNKLATTEMPGNPSGGPYSGTYSHDERGNMTAMPHLSTIAWDWADRMQSADLGGGGTVYFVYDSAGQRVRKVWDKTSALRDERIYLGGYEIWRESTVSGGTATVQEERQTLHVMDDVRRIAMVETLTVTGGSTVTSPTSRQRYQLADQLESTCVEVKEDGSIISYEEYFPFGATSFRSETGEVSKRRYRYNGKERDEETALHYYGARYYAAWLGRWTRLDPVTVDGPNRYAYVRNNPVRIRDPHGLAGDPRLTSLENAARGAVAVVAGRVGIDPAAAASATADLEQRARDALFRQQRQHVGPRHLTSLRRTDELNVQTPTEKLHLPKVRSATTQALTAGGEGGNGSVRIRTYPTGRPIHTVPDPVGQPGAIEGMIPVWGAGRTAIDELQRNHPVAGIFWSGMAISDIFFVKGAVVGGARALGRLAFRELLEQSERNSAEGLARAGRTLYEGEASRGLESLKQEQGAGRAVATQEERALFDASKTTDTLYQGTATIDNNGARFIKATSILAKMQLTAVQKAQVVQGFATKIGFGFGAEGLVSKDAYLLLRSEDHRYAFRFLRATGAIEYGKFDMATMNYAWKQL